MIKYRGLDFISFVKMILKQNHNIVASCVVIIFFIVCAFSWAPPIFNFPAHTAVRIEEGTSIKEAGILLEERGFVGSAGWFSFFAGIYGRKGGIKAGDYYFEQPLSVSDVALRIARGEYGLTPIRITIPEGLNVFQMAPLFAKEFSFFNEEEFIKTAPEGYLFPDTYFFLPNADASDVISKMRATYEEKIVDLRKEIVDQGKNEYEILILASIIEEEARGEMDKRMVSGILKKRMEIDMPLQVDATFSYVNGKNSYTLTKEDLFDESPYNTYRNKGLPPTPIANPGIESIRAALYPIETNNLYFLTDLAGNMYFAETFEGHQTNRELYLRR